MRRFWLLPLAALIAVLPLLTGGHSCGHDFAFHMQSWLGAADQLRHGVLFPRWNSFAAYNAGEPRFIFYPPLSWLLGAVLTLLLPFNLVPTAVTWIILTLAGFSMFRLARAYAPEPIALLAACVFLANPFMLWTITGRNAYAELLAAAFCPLLLAALLAARPNAWRIGPALALLWLSNVPGGVIGTYVLLFLAAVRLAQAARSPVPRRWKVRLFRLLPLATIFAGGLAYGLALAAFFLIPAIYERRFIHMADAFLPPLRPVDNLFLHRILLPERDAFFIRTEHIAFIMAAITCAALLVAWISHAWINHVWINHVRINHKRSHDRADWQQVGGPTAALTLALVFCMTFLSAPLWRVLPEAWLVQFPWRTLFVLGACLALAVALALRRSTVRPLPAVLAGLAITASLAYCVIGTTRVACSADREPQALQADFQRSHAPEPIDEYVVATGSADFLRPDNPPFWLARNPADYAPNTTPNPAAIDSAAEWLIVPDDAQLQPTLLRFSVTTPTPAFVVVNLQDYPNWRITRNRAEVLPHLRRQDSLLTVALPAGTSSLSITWHHSWDEYLGGALSLMAFLAFLMSRRRARALLLVAGSSH